MWCLLLWPEVGRLQDEDGKIVGCRVKDTLTGKQHDVYAKMVINATGPFSDGIRQMSDSSRVSHLPALLQAAVQA